MLDRHENLDRLHVRVELNSTMFQGDMDALNKLKKKLVEELKALITVNPRIELLEPGSLPPSTGKAVRVIDNRKI